MKLLFWVVVLLLAVVLASFAGSNREAVSLTLWPLPFVAELPLYVAVLLTLILGFILGAIAAWHAGRSRRREARRRGRRIAVLERELTATQAQLPVQAERGPAGLPARL